MRPSDAVKHWWCGVLPRAGIVLVLLASVAAAVVEVPPLRGRVNDYAGLLKAEQVRRLESQLAQFETETGHQVVVLTLPTLDGEDIEGFSIRVAEKWQIGKAGFDNGVILVVASGDRRLRLEVGYGLEGVLPDAIAKRILSEYIVPRFRVQDYPGGISAGIEAVLSVIKNEPLPQTQRPQNRTSESPLELFLMLAITLAVLGTMALASRSSRRRHNMWATGGRHHPPIYWGSRGLGGGFSGGSRGGFGGGFGGGGGSFGGGGASSSW